MRATLAAGARGGDSMVPGQVAVVRDGPQLPPPHHRCRSHSSSRHQGGEAGDEEGGVGGEIAHKGGGGVWLLPARQQGRL